MDTPEMFRRAVAEFDGRVRQIGAHQWQAPTPDEGWSVRDLVNHVVPRDQLESTARGIAMEIAEAPLTTLRATKLMVKRAWELMGMRAHLQWSNDMLTVCTAHTDVRDQIRATIADLVKTRPPK